MTAAPITLVRARLSQGVWEAELSAPATPEIAAWHQGSALPGVEVAPRPDAAGRFLVRVPIPGTILSDGIETVLIRSGDMQLAEITILAGVPLDSDLRAEIGLLRAELDLLKRAFRRHCVETGSV